MRDFKALESPLKRKILDGYFKNEITFEQLETEFNISAESFKTYVVDNLQEKYIAFNPPPKQTFKQDILIAFKKLRDNILTDGFVKITLLFLLFQACIIVPTKIGIKVSPLASLAIEKAGIALLVFMIGKVFFEVFTLFTDRKEWLYSTAFVRPEFGYDKDFHTLTPYQRCVLSLSKRAVRMVVYALLFLGILLQ